MIKVIYLLMAVILISCTTAPNTLSNNLLAPPPGTAYAIVSITGFSFEPNYTHFEIQFRSLKNNNKNSIHVNLLQDTIFSHDIGGPTTSGKVALLHLPVGHYRFESAYGSYMDPDEGGKKYVFPLSLEFSLAEKETIYLGEIHFDLSLIPKLIFSDQHPRDFGHIQRMFQINDLTQIKIRPLQAKSS